MTCGILAKRVLVIATLILCVQISNAGWVRISPLEGNVGDSIKVTGGYFTPDSNIGIYFDDKIIGITKSDLKGSFSVRVEVPEAPCGDHKVMVVDEVKNNAYTEFNLTPKLTKFSSKEGEPGTLITIAGKGFSANSEVELMLVNLFEIPGMVYKEILVKKTAKTNEKGTFEVKFEVPKISPGYYFIYAKDPICGVETDYTKFEVLEPKATPTPTPPPTTPFERELTPTPTPSIVKEVVKQIITSEKTPVSKRSIPGFELALALAGVATALLISRRL